VGFFAATIKNVGDTKIGDTVTEDARPAAAQLPGFEDIKPMVFAGFIPWIRTSTRCCATRWKNYGSTTPRFFSSRKAGRARLRIPLRISRPAAHEIIQERLEREYALDLITTAPGVRYHITLTDGSVLEVDNPSRWPEPTNVEEIREPVITAKILTNEEYVGGILKLVEEKRGKQLNFEYVTPTRVMLTYELPLNEIVLDFYDRLKSISRGYASLDYQLAGEWESPMVKMDILVSGEPVDALSIIVHRDFAYERASCWSRRCVSSFRGNSSRLPSRPRSAPRSLRARRWPRCARTYWPSATAAIFRANASCWKSKRKARNV